MTFKRIEPNHQALAQDFDRARRDRELFLARLALPVAHRLDCPGTALACIADAASEEVASGFELPGSS